MKGKIHIFNSFKRIPKLLKKGQIFVAFDTETTGVASATEKIIELAAIKFNCNGIIDSYSTLINPQKTISYFITNLTHITQDMVDDKPVFFNIADEFLNFIGDSILIAHNAQFDIRFLNSELDRLNKSAIKNKVIDTLRFAQLVYPKPETTSWNLKSLAEKLKITINESHRAYDDARVCMELFFKCTKKIEDSSREEPQQDQSDFRFETPSK